MNEDEHPTIFNTPTEVVESIKLFAGNKMVKMKPENADTRTKKQDDKSRRRRAVYRNADADYVARFIERSEG